MVLFHNQGEKMEKKVFSILAIGFLIISAVALTGCTSDDETFEPKAKMNVLGTEANLTDTYDLTPEQGNEFLWVEVEVESQNEEEDLSLSTVDFKMTTEEGSVYEMPQEDGAPDKITPGTTATFSLVFEIPRDETGEELRFEPGWGQEDPFTADIPSYESTNP